MKSISRRQSLTTVSAGTLAATAAFAKPARAMLVVLAMVMAAVMIPNPSFAQQKKLVLWTHWEQNPDFNKWYEAKGKEFAKKTGYEVKVLTFLAQGYEPRYRAVLRPKGSAPDIFRGMTHQWCVKYIFCKKMPADLAKAYDENLP